jgi:hypothetical protein
MYTDSTLKAQSRSHRQNLYAQVFTIPLAWIQAYGIKQKSDAHEALSDLLRDVGAPEALVMDGSKEQTLGDFRKKARGAGIHIKQTEPHTQKSNHAEAAIRELKNSTRRKMVKMKSPTSLWDDCLELEADIMSHRSHDGFMLQGQVPHAMVTGQTCDISRLAEFGWCQWIWWFDKHDRFPDPRKVLGRYLRLTRDIGMAMTAKILKGNGRVVYRSSFIAITEDEMKDPNVKKDMETFVDRTIELKLGGIIKDEDYRDDKTPDDITYSDDDQDPAMVGDPPKLTPERDEVDVSTYEDPYICGYSYRIKEGNYQPR